MNLNEFLINRGRGRGKRCNRNKNYTDMGPPLAPPVKKKHSTPLSDLNWGNNHISVANTSSMHKSAGSTKFSLEDDSRVIIALTEGRGEARCEVGMAVVNVSKPLLILCQISDAQSYVNTLTKINIFNPQEILVPVTFVENFTGNRLIDKVKNRFPGIKYTGCPRNTFNKTSGMDALSNLCIPSLNAILLVLQHRYYALAAASALITYVQDSLFVYYTPGSIKIDYQESEGYAIIDVSTADRLELVCSAKPAQGNKYSSLFGVLNHCMTKIGSRTLRSAVLQPLCEVRYIEERLDAVEELIKHPTVLLSIQALLQKVPNIDNLLSVATLGPDDSQKCSNRQLNYILLLNTLIDLIAPLREVLAKSAHPFFAGLVATLASEDFAAIRRIVRDTVQENAHPAKGEAAVMQRCFAIKPGINGLLDLVRKTYSERLDDMRQYVKGLAEKYELPLTLGNNQTKGHHIVFNLNKRQRRYTKKSDLPDEFIEVHRLVGSFTMKTPKLVNMSTRLDDIMADILRISNVMVHTIVLEIKKYLPLFHKLCEEIAYLDVLQSLAECSATSGYVRPRFGEFTEVAHAHHPMLDFLLSSKPVPNSISCSKDYNLHIITGPNGSGKSVFIRQVVLLQVMAQVGCYVPAQSATFRSADRMYARIYLEDNMEHGASSFILEMKEINYIMTTMTENSLVVIDELCRSTSLEEGTAIAIAVVEKLAQYSTFVYITTHFTLLTKLYDMYLNVKVWHLETIPSGEDPKTFKLDFRHNLVEGVTTVKRYGVYIVRNIWPDSILKHVDALLDKISKKPKNPKFETLDEKIRLKYKFESEFRKLKSQRKLTVSEMNKLLNQYREEMEKLGSRIDKLHVSYIGENVQQETPKLDHSIFGDVARANSTADLNLPNAAIQRFTPEPSISSQVSMDLGTQQTEERMRAVFTPQASQQSTDPTCPNVNFYRNYSNDNYENVSRFIAEASENIHKLVPEVNISYAETLPSHKGGSVAASTPMMEDNASPVVRVYGNDRNFSTSTNDQSRSFRAIIPDRIALEGYDVESIHEDLEVCSQIFGQEDDDFEEESLKSLPLSRKGAGRSETFPQHIFPVVEVVEGPNDTTLSCGEDTDDEPKAPNKINIISDIVLVPTKPIEEDITEKGEIEDDQDGPDETGPVEEEIKRYRHFDSTSEANSTINDDNRHMDQERSSGYELVVIEDPKQFITSSSIDKTTNKVEKPEESGDEQDKSNPTKAETTSISYASKLRKLERSSSDSSQQDPKTTTSISGASKMRNLDQATTDSTSPNDKTNTNSLKESGGSTNPETPKKKFSVPKSIDQSQKNPRKGVFKRKKFVPPRKLTAKEIREEFQEQDRKMLATSPTSSNFSKYLEQRIKRPTVKQVRDSTHLARIRRTEEGVEVIEATPLIEKTTTPWKRQFSNENFNAAIFSDKNAVQFESYLNSDEKDYDKFSFNFSKEGKKFQFAPTTSRVGEYTDDSVTTRFVRTMSGAVPNPQEGRSFDFGNNREEGPTTSCVGSVTTRFVRTLSGAVCNPQEGRSFNFAKSHEEGRGLQFTPTTPRVSDYANEGVARRFVRTISETLRNQDEGSAGNLKDFTFLMSQRSANQSLTPDGFYKQNKTEIKGLVDKYMQGTQEKRFGNGNNSRNIFDTNDVDSTDLDI